MADKFDAIMISCTNGHVDLYLIDFATKFSLFRQSTSEPKVWFLGGNLSVKEANDTIIRKYLAMGFDYVAPKPVAAMSVLRNKTRDYLNSLGYHDVTVSTVFHQYMAAFPSDRDKARELILNSSITATLSGADRIMTKTPVESIHIPTKKNNAEGLGITFTGMKKAGDVNINREEVLREIRLISREVDALMNYIAVAVNGSYARGAIKAFSDGVLDIPFSPSVYNRGRLFGAKDCNGAIRFINPENLPFSEDIKDYHREKISWRMTLQRARQTHEVLEHDLTRIWKNDYLCWPLDDHYIV